MGLLEKIFSRPRSEMTGLGWRTFTEVNPTFSPSWSGTVYEQELTRAAIERFATACSKLKPEIVGNSKNSVSRIIKTSPNQVMTWSTFLRRLGAIYDGDGTAAVVPSFDRDMRTIVGLFPLRFQTAEIIEAFGEPWVKFYFITGQSACLKLNEVCFITKFQVDSDIFGEPNCLNSTLQLIHAQEEAQKMAIKNGAKIRFIGKLNGQVREEDMQKKRERFLNDNLVSDNNGGMMTYDQTWESVIPVEPQSWTISDSEMQRITDNVCTYFGISKAILQNDYDEDSWSAWYEGKVEPFAIALGEGLSKLVFTQAEMYSKERGYKNRISFSSNRLEYASNASKRNMARDMLDRGVITLNEAREMLQLPPVDDGDIRVIRGEYVNAADVSTIISTEEDEDVDAVDNDYDSDMTKGDYDPARED